ncbi:MAG: polysaccharide biosynthesis tyrosine autokinase [Candidatus Aminicenantales bacterium]
MDIKAAPKEIEFFEYVKVIAKRRGLIIAFAAAVLLLTAIFSFLATPKFRATATLLIEEESSKMLSLEDSFGNPSRGYQDLRFFNTQLKLIKSKSLVEKVAKKMRLQSLIVRQILSKIEVRPLRETKLVELSFVANSPELAADLVNTLADEFISYSIVKRYETTQQASDFLSEQIANLRDELAAKEQEMQRYGQEKDMFFLSDSQSTAGNKFADLNQAYNQAIIARVNAETAYREIKDLDVDSIPQFVNNPVVQALRTDYMRTKNDYDEKIKKFKPDYPEMVQLAARLESMRTDLRRAVATAETEYQSALNREYSLKALLEKQKVDLAKMNQNAIIYNNLKTEVETKRQLYDSLVQRQNETLVSSRLGGLKSSYISIVDRAQIPRFPIFPRTKLNLALALLLGLFGGVCLAFFAEYLDNTIKSAEDVERLAGLPSLGVIPHHDHLGGIELLSLQPADSLPSEYYRTIRTSIMFSAAGKPMKCIAVTSTMAQEGKTSIVSNLAISFSQLNQKVLLIEADLRRPRLHEIFKVRRIKGMSNYLAGQTPLIEAAQASSVENIWILPCGPLPPNPAELLNSQKMKDLIDEAKQIFDVVLIDTPPLLAVVDPLIVASMADGVALVVQANKTARKPFARAVEELRRSNARIIGVILNDVKMTRQDFYYRNYYHSDQPGPAAQRERESQ